MPPKVNIENEGLLAVRSTLPTDRGIYADTIGGQLFAQSLPRKKQGAASRSSDAASSPVVFAEFNITSGKYVPPIKGIPLGRNRPWRFTNAVELIFRVEPKAVKEIGIYAYRCRQQGLLETWQRRLDNGTLTPWEKFPLQQFPDNPEPDFQFIQSPLICFYDGPGFDVSSPQDQTLPMSRNGVVKSSPAAVHIYQRMNFTSWVEGRTSVRWMQLSDTVKWHSIQALERSPFGDRTWKSNRYTEIGVGQSSGSPPSFLSFH